MIPEISIYLTVPLLVGFAVIAGYLFVTMRVRRRLDCSAGMFVLLSMVEVAGRAARWWWSLYKALDAFACEWRKLMTAPRRRPEIAALIHHRKHELPPGMSRAEHEAADRAARLRRKEVADGKTETPLVLGLAR